EGPLVILGRERLDDCVQLRPARCTKLALEQEVLDDLGRLAGWRHRSYDKQDTLSEMKVLCRRLAREHGRAGGLLLTRTAPDLARDSGRRLVRARREQRKFVAAIRGCVEREGHGRLEAV